MQIEITLDPARVDAVAAHAYLSSAYWCEGVPLEVVQRAIAHSLCVAALADGRQIGFGRAVTDQATFAYLADVYVLPEFQRRGIARRMLQALLDDGRLQGLRRKLLATRDAHALYAAFGFKPLAAPQRMMEVHVPNAYR